MKKILVTGGAGFIGSHTCLLLLERGYKVVVLDSLVNSSQKAIKQINKLYRKKDCTNNNTLHFYKGDLRDKQFLENIFHEGIISNEPIDGVIHFAGLKSVQESVLNPLEYWDSNVNSSLRLLETMDKFLCRNFVFSSSATVYGSWDKEFLDEKLPLLPSNPYGKTKQAVENILIDKFNSSKDWKIINMRYFNPIGAHRSGMIGEDPKGSPNNLFPILLKVANKEIDYLRIFGDDWETEDGTCVRDYIHVSELAEGHIKALEHLNNSAPKILSFNVGTGLGTSVLDLVNIFENTIKIKIPYKITSRREGDIKRIVASNNKLKTILGWSPKIKINQMCIDGWRFKKNYPKGYI